MANVQKVLISLLLLAACGPAPVNEFVAVHQDHSLFWKHDVLLDDPGLISFAKLMAISAPDGHGGRLLEQWFNRFNTTAFSERSAPAQFIFDWSAAHGSDPAQWDLSQMGFKMTGVHNRIDRAEYAATGHCGELRASASSTDLMLQPFHVLFIFRQPAGEGDRGKDGRVNCEATAKRWSALSKLEGDALLEAVRKEIRAGFVRERFELIETVEQSVAPWEWRQWVKTSQASGPLEFTLENPALFQQLDVEGLNAAGARRAAFLGWVADNAEALSTRSLLFPEEYRRPVAQVSPTKVFAALSLTDLRADVATKYPQLRQELEINGCPACHTADAEFVQTSTQRVVSTFYEKELIARERHLEQLALGLSPFAPFGPLQPRPVLPP